MIKLTGDYIFPNHENLTFKDPTIIVDNKVKQVDPNTMTIEVNAYIERTGSISGRYYLEINPVPVLNLNYDSGELLQRVEDRLADFKI